MMNEMTVLEAKGIARNVIASDMSVMDLYAACMDKDMRFSANKARNISVCAVVRAQCMGYSVREFMDEYIIAKKAVSTDRGRFGDILETLVSYYMRGFNTLSQIHVKESGKFDLTAGGIVYEIGHNGKTFTRCSGFTSCHNKEELTADIMLYNEPDYIIYGCVDFLDDNTTIDELDYLAKKAMYIFTKEQFTDMLKNVKKKGFHSAIKTSEQGATIQYNSQFCDDFYNYMEKHAEIPTVEKYAKR